MSKIFRTYLDEHIWRKYFGQKYVGRLFWERGREREGRGGEEQAKNEGGEFGRVELDLAETIQGVTF